MQHFNSPPDWPAPPSPDWKPPRGWRPDPSWPAPPPGWRYWTNERGGRSLGPVGAYGATSRAPLITAGSVAAVVLVAALASLGSGSPSGSGASGTPPAQTTTVTVTERQPVTVTQPQATVTKAGPTITKPGPTVQVTVRPPRVTVTATRRAPVVPPPAEDVYYANCSEARAAGDTPLYAGDPGYADHLDRDHDGVACE